MGKDIFNPDSYTEEAMPIVSAFCRAINNNGKLDHVSKATLECREKQSVYADKFNASLTDEQRDMYIDLQNADTDAVGIEINEYFNRGFLFGVLLMKELLT